MSSTIGWIAKNILFPLSFFFMGALIRYLYQGDFNISIFDPAELSFSMAMLSLLITLNSNKLRDQHLSTSLTTLSTIAMVTFLVLFVLSSFTNIHIQHCSTICVETIKDNLVKNPIQNFTAADISKVFTNQNVSFFENIIDRIRIFSFILSVIVVLFSILCKHKYNLED